MQRLERFGERLWIASGPTVDFIGFPYETRMVVAELADGLWVWSPVELDPVLEAEVRGLGAVKWIVSPNKLHHLYIAPWLAAFEGARAFAPPGLARRRKDLAFAGALGDEPDDAWSRDIDQVRVHGSFAATEVIFFHRPSSTCIVGDLIQRMAAGGFAGWQRAIMRLNALVGPKGSTPREWRATFVRRDRGRRALAKMLAWEPAGLIVAHGECAHEGGEELLRDAFRWLTRPWPL